MKKIYKVWLFFVAFVIFATMIANKTTVYAMAEEAGGNSTPPNNTQYETESDYRNFLVSYYDQLTRNYPNNQVGTCGYVAMSMYLSYYDTILSDNIIPNNYDIVARDDGNGNYADSYNMIKRDNSPGVHSDNVALSKYSSPQECLDAYEEIEDESLQARLITIAAENGAYNANAANIGDAAFTDYLDIKDILIDYLEQVANLNSTQFNVVANVYLFSNSARTKAIEKVQSGVPVILGVMKDDNARSGNGGDGHWVIAYDYDEENDLLYCHAGWDEDRAHITMESEFYDRYTEVVYVNWNIEHSCSNNYGASSANGIVNYYCAQCDDDVIYTYHNGHRYDYDYDTYSVRQHEALCVCGDSIYEGHTISGDICSLCSQTHIPHNCTYTVLDQDKHRKYCECGLDVLENHTWDSNYQCSYCDYQHTHNYTHSCIFMDANTHKNICSCGLYEIDNHNINVNEVCTGCGYTTAEHIHSFTYIPHLLLNRHTKSCTTCEYSKSEACIGQIFWGSDVTYCSKCGGEMGSLPPIVMGFGEEGSELYQNAFLTALNDLQSSQAQE